MRHSNILWIFMVLVISGLLFSACTKKSAPTKIKPATVEHIDGTELSKIILTEKAAERLGIETDKVRIINMSTPKKVVPYSSLLYDVNGGTWVYTNPEPLVFVRHRITVDYIKGSLVFLIDGPAVGTEVVIVGATELFGAEFEIGH